MAEICSTRPDLRRRNRDQANAAIRPHSRCSDGQCAKSPLSEDFRRRLIGGDRCRNLTRVTGVIDKFDWHLPIETVTGAGRTIFRAFAAAGKNRRRAGDADGAFAEFQPHRLYETGEIAYREYSTEPR